MLATVTVALAQGDSFGMTPDEAAAAVLAALNGDPAVDTCTVQVTTPVGAHGADAEPPPPPDLYVPDLPSPP